MKKRVFRDDIVLVILGRPFICAIAAAPPFLFYCLCSLLSSIQEQAMDVLVILIGVAIAIACCVVLLPFLWPRCFGKLIVTEDRIIWRCMFMKSHTIRIADCHYAGFHAFTQGNVVKDVRGAGFRMVYVSSHPYPTEFIGRINKLKISDTFIKFNPSYRLCKTLRDLLPEPQNRVFSTYCEVAERELARMQRKKEKQKAKNRISK